MISARVAITAAHCVSADMDLTNPTYSDGEPLKVELTNSVQGEDPLPNTIQEIRVNDCWFENKFISNWSCDLAILILADKKPSAAEGTDYIRIWDDDSDEDGDICDCEVDEFALMGWGYSGPVGGDYLEQ